MHSRQQRWRRSSGSCHERSFVCLAPNAKVPDRARTHVRFSLSTDAGVQLATGRAPGQKRRSRPARDRVRSSRHNGHAGNFELHRLGANSGLMRCIKLFSSPRRPGRGALAPSLQTPSLNLRAPRRELGGLEATYLSSSPAAAKGGERHEALIDNTCRDLCPIHMLARFRYAIRESDVQRDTYLRADTGSSLWLVSQSRPSLRMVARPTSLMVALEPAVGVANHKDWKVSQARGIGANASTRWLTCLANDYARSVINPAGPA